jgi:hypothetical protein
MLILGCFIIIFVFLVFQSMNESCITIEVAINHPCLYIRHYILLIRHEDPV